MIPVIAAIRAAATALRGLATKAATSVATKAGSALKSTLGIGGKHSIANKAIDKVTDKAQKSFAQRIKSIVTGNRGTHEINDTDTNTVDSIVSRETSDYVSRETSAPQELSLSGVTYAQADQMAGVLYDMLQSYPGGDQLQRASMTADIMRNPGLAEAIEKLLTDEDYETNLSDADNTSDRLADLVGVFTHG